MNNKPIIKVEDIGKQYRLGAVGTGTLSHDINRWWHKVRGKEDPYLKIGEANDRTQSASSEYVWALRNINFEVQQGTIIGIIGKNGAGKSTLLKLLSRVTAPSIGKITCHGRIASLLEVGTGFHPELTGRENIYLNGAILGMTKKEIAAKFDEIVDFAGCTRYINTPVKRYSSGMYVRLAFAVAAHLEPDILVVDEVLAVGDAEFQKKAIGKMKEVSQGQGRTVLFVSHNMASIQNLCESVIVLDKGNISFNGKADLGISKYLAQGRKYTVTKLIDRKDRVGLGSIKFKDFEILKKTTFEPIKTIISGDGVIFSFEVEVLNKTSNVNFRIQFFDNEHRLKFLCNNLHSSVPFETVNQKTKVECYIPKFPLFQGDYYVNLRCRSIDGIEDDIEYAFNITVENGDFFNTGNLPGIKEGILVDHKWKLK